ncbi:uncharacterized protein C11orf91 homolog [Protopterus annectens]|uniref:uncharacterized protein C11orf91 homolog n=1 Tax=Protopterus annectens TaxID=7888 RepID=UPI001CFBC5F3|nr:uncharacterized protein C11orf91 homolog [Protopterus annectens]
MPKAKNKVPVRYFPSLYDNYPTSSTADGTGREKKVLEPKIDHHPQQLPTAAHETAPAKDSASTSAAEVHWPPGLAHTQYDPLQFFTLPGRSSSAWTEVDEICELSIRLKEVELLTLMGEKLDRTRYEFLKKVRDEVMQDIHEAHKRKKHIQTLNEYVNMDYIYRGSIFKDFLK